MKNVMVRAWEIARAAVIKFGGKVREYLAAALRQVWLEVKTPAKVEWELPADTRKFRTWMARITGIHPVYKLERKFINQDGVDQYGDKLFYLANGVYEANDGRRRKFIHVTNGSYRIIEQADVLVAIA